MVAQYRCIHAPVPPQAAPPIFHGLNYVSSLNQKTLCLFFLFPYVRTVHLINQSVCVEWMGRPQCWLSRRSPHCNYYILIGELLIQYGIVMKKSVLVLSMSVCSIILGRAFTRCKCGVALPPALLASRLQFLMVKTIRNMERDFCPLRVKNIKIPHRQT